MNILESRESFQVTLETIQVVNTTSKIKTWSLHLWQYRGFFGWILAYSWVWIFRRFSNESWEDSWTNPKTCLWPIPRLGPGPYTLNYNSQNIGGGVFHQNFRVNPERVLESLPRSMLTHPKGVLAPKRILELFAKGFLSQDREDTGANPERIFGPNLKLLWGQLQEDSLAHARTSLRPIPKGFLGQSPIFWPSGYSREDIRDNPEIVIEPISKRCLGQSQEDPWAVPERIFGHQKTLGIMPRIFPGQFYQDSGAYYMRYDFRANPNANSWPIPRGFLGQSQADP